MRVTLVTCFNANWNLGRVPAPYIPLNLLCLAAGLKDQGHTIEIIDQTLALLAGQATDGPEFHAQIAGLIANTRPDVVGLTTMCNSYPQTLALARRYRAAEPRAKLVLGGPQATVTDALTLEAFPWIDAVVRGEADASFPQLVARWERADPLDDVPGITWRDGGHVRSNPDAPLLLDMDQLPLPAYELYPMARANLELVPLEAGRGCPYGCTFCSTNVFFNRRYRIKSPERLITEMKRLQELGGWTRFDFVHDMFTVDRRWVRGFCRTMTAAGLPFKWGCSARVDRVDPELLAEMAEAGCLGIFFGIETGSQRLQPVIKKNLKMHTVLPIIRACVANNLSTTASCITGYPEETAEDALDSFNLALDVLQVSPKTRAQMHMLAPLIGSPLYTEHQDELSFDGHSSDISLFLLTDEDVEVVRRHPKIFPNFYYMPTPHVERDLLKAVSAATYTCPQVFLALRHAGADLKQVLEGWVDWNRRNRSGREGGQDYYFYYFGLDMCRYFREAVLQPLLERAPYLADMVDYFELKYSFQRRHLTDATLFRQYAYDVHQLGKALRTDGVWEPHLAAHPTDLLFVNLATTPERGYAYLEVRVPRQEVPLISPGDEVEVRDPVKQIKARPHLIIRNRTKQKVFATQHHMTPRHLRALGIQAV